MNGVVRHAASNVDAEKMNRQWTRNSKKGGDPFAYNRTWSKEAYGGEYYVARSGLGNDAMKSDQKVELGYEKADGGLTTNFVGNHMTQGAIDLVQAELNRPDPYYEARQLMSRGGKPKALPQKIETDHKALALARELDSSKMRKAPSEYEWQDNADGIVYVRIKLPHNSSVVNDDVVGKFEPRKCRVEWTTKTHHGNMIENMAFVIRNTWGIIDAKKCEVRVDGDDEQDGSGGDTLSFKYIVIALMKLENDVEQWKALERPSALVAAANNNIFGSGGGGGGSNRNVSGGERSAVVDARALRRSLQAARAAREGQTATGSPIRSDADQEAAVAAAMAQAATIAAGTDAPVTSLPETYHALCNGDTALPEGLSAEGCHAEGNSLFQNGEYDGAVTQYTWALRLVGYDDAPAGIKKDSTDAVSAASDEQLANFKATLLTNRATALAQVGAFDACERDCTRALEFAPSSCKTLLRRALAREHQEKFQAAAQDARCVLEILPSERRASDLLRRCAKVMNDETKRLQRLAQRHAVLSEAELHDMRHAVKEMQLDGKESEILPKAQEGTNYFNTNPGKRPGAI